jgi:2-phospho-L-lactate guanylyltransferase
VSPDEEVLNFARANGVIGVVEPGVELNEALKLAVDYAVAEGASSVLILPSDLPLLRAADIENIIAMASSPRDIVIAPSKDNGTNALLLLPPDVMNLRFGGESFPSHIAEARRVGVRPRIYRSVNVSTDVDDVEDLLKVETHGLGTRTQSFLRSLRQIRPF